MGNKNQIFKVIVGGSMIANPLRVYALSRLEEAIKKHQTLPIYYIKLRARIDGGFDHVATEHSYGDPREESVGVVLNGCDALTQAVVKKGAVPFQVMGLCNQNGNSVNGEISKNTYIWGYVDLNPSSKNAPSAQRRSAVKKYGDTGIFYNAKGYEKREKDIKSMDERVVSESINILYKTMALLEWRKEVESIAPRLRIGTRIFLRKKNSNPSDDTVVFDSVGKIEITEKEVKYYPKKTKGICFTLENDRGKLCPTAKAKNWEEIIYFNPVDIPPLAKASV